MNDEYQVAGQDVYDYPLLIKNLFSTALAQYPDREIVYADKCRFTYVELRARIARLASALTAHGVKPGDTVAVMDWDSHRYLESFFAIPMMGAVLHTVNIRLAPEQILYTINHARDDWILVHEDFLPIIEAISSRFESHPRFVLLTEDDASRPTSSVNFEASYEALVESGDSGFQFPDFVETTRATTFYTTGTTGEPKGVYYNHRQIIIHTLAVTAGVAMASGHGRVHRDDVYMPITPMFHVHAWGMPFVVTMMGLTQVYPGRYEPERLLALIDREKVTFSHCVPTILRMLLSSPAAKKMDLSNWKVVIGGSALPQALAEEALALGIDVFSGYGMSETCPVVTLAQRDKRDNESDDLVTRCLSGRALPLVEMSIVDQEGEVLPANGIATGELVLRAPWLTHGYFRNQVASDALWQGGYLHTGDVASIDQRGYLKIQDRIKDVIKSGGEWISSVALEDIASQSGAVIEAAAIGVPDEQWDERPKLLVILSADFDEAAAEVDIRARIDDAVMRGELSKWAIPEQIEVVTELAKTSVGKLDKKVLRKTYS